MRILYAIQGTGNGHLSRSMDIVPLLKKMGDVDVLVSGTQGDLSLPFQVKYVAAWLSVLYSVKKAALISGIRFLKSRLRKFINRDQFFTGRGL